MKLSSSEDSCESSKDDVKIDPVVYQDIPALKSVLTSENK